MSGNVPEPGTPAIPMTILLLSGKDCNLAEEVQSALCSRVTEVSPDCGLISKHSPSTLRASLSDVASREDMTVSRNLRGHLKARPHDTHHISHDAVVVSVLMTDTGLDRATSSS